MSHPVRSVLVNLLGARPGSGAAELARWSDLPIRRVRGQLKILADDGLIRVQREETRRGVVKRYYANAVELAFSEDDEEELSERTRFLATLGTLRLLFDGARRAVATGMVGTRPERVIGNTFSEVDEQGWLELAELHDNLLTRTQEVIAESRARLEASGEKPTVPFVAGVILLESPPLEDDDSPV